MVINPFFYMHETITKKGILGILKIKNYEKNKNYENFMYAINYI